MLFSEDVLINSESTLKGVHNADAEFWPTTI